MAKKNNGLPSSLLGAIAALLLSAAFLMKPFPLLAFAGLAPLYAIAMRLEPGKTFWEPLEIIGLALAISFYSFHFFEGAYIVQGILQAIGLAICFGLFGWTKEQLGARTSTLAVILFWLAFEYVVLKVHPRDQYVFLSDAFALRKEWVRWNIHTGYLGAGLWVLVVNWLLYQGTLVEGLRWPWIIAALVLIGGPIGYSYLLDNEALNKTQMVTTYAGQAPDGYPKNGELVGRTSAWISVLVLLFAAVKSNTRKK